MDLRSCRMVKYTWRSPLAPLQKGGTGVKVPLIKGDLGGSRAVARFSKVYGAIGLNG
jgi:hypothetical protein